MRCLTTMFVILCAYYFQIGTFAPLPPDPDYNYYGELSNTQRPVLSQSHFIQVLDNGKSLFSGTVGPSNKLAMGYEIYVSNGTHRDVFMRQA